MSSIYLNDKNMISRKIKNKSTLLIQGRNDRTLLLTRDELRFEPEKLNWRESSAKYISSQAYDISLRICEMFTTIRDESDRLLKSATVLLISFDFVPLLFHFITFDVCRCCVLYRDPRSQICSFLENIVQRWDAWTSRVKFIEIISVYGYWYV